MLEITWLHPLIITIFTSVFTQVIFFRLSSDKNIYRSLIIGFLLGLSSLLIYSYFQPTKISLLIGNLIIFVLFMYSYFHWINMGETARRIRILIEIGSAKNGMALNELEKSIRQNRYLV